MITELQLKEAILKSALDVPPFMSIADFNHEVRLLHKEIVEIAIRNREVDDKVEVKIITDMDEYHYYRVLDPSVLSYNTINKEEVLKLGGKEYKIDVDTHIGLEEIREKTN